MTAPSVAELRANMLFAGLDDDQLTWLARTAEHLSVPDGTTLFREGEPATALIVLVEGELLITHRVDGREEVLTRHSTRTHADPDEHGDKPSAAHGFTGETPLLAGTDYIATATATGPTRVLRYTRESFEEMIVRCPQVCQVLLPVLAWRLHASAAQAGQRATVTALGTLAAGLAHELNNPSAAVVRGADALAVALDDLRSAAVLWASTAGPADAEALDAVTTELLDRQVRIVGRDQLADAEAEEEVEDWLDDRGIDDRVLVTPLVERGLGVRWLDGVAERLSAPALNAALAQLGAAVAARTLVGDIGDAGRRISGIVAATKEYTNLDRAPEQRFDLAAGIEATLVMLAPRLTGIRLHRDYATDLPPVLGYPVELNQVWTNLLDNAADALDGSGELWVHTRRDGGCVLADIVDSGPGVPPGALDRIFEPFFTTKDIGKGTGLGLHLSHRIVTQRHHGSLTVQSRPGRTRFRVRIPLDVGAPDACPAPTDHEELP